MVPAAPVLAHCNIGGASGRVLSFRAANAALGLWSRLVCVVMSHLFPALLQFLFVQ